MYKTEFKKKILPKILPYHPEASHLFDSGFQGVNELIPTARIPIKKQRTPKKTKKRSGGLGLPDQSLATTDNPQPKKIQLTKEQKAANTVLSKERIPIENKNRDIKIFRICKETRRHKQKYHNKFWTIVCGITNFKSCTAILSTSYLFLFNLVCMIGFS